MPTQYNKYTKDNNTHKTTTTQGTYNVTSFYTPFFRVKQSVLVIFKDPQNVTSDKLTQEAKLLTSIPEMLSSITSGTSILGFFVVFLSHSTKITGSYVTQYVTHYVTTASFYVL